MPFSIVQPAATAGVASHASSHQIGGTDALSPAAIGAAAASHASTHQTGGGDFVANVVNSPSSLSADQNNYSLPSADIVRITSGASRNITGFAAGSSGQAVLLINIGSYDITIKHESASSSAANRVTVPWASDCVLSASGGAATLVYDATSTRWRVV